MFVDPFDCDQKQTSTQETNYVEFSDFQKIDIRVGMILSAEDGYRMKMNTYLSSK
jgi:hypothetical protein